jgi:hypothetical protein
MRLSTLLGDKYPNLFLQEAYRHTHCCAVMWHVFLAQDPFDEHDDFGLYVDPEVGV